MPLKIYNTLSRRKEEFSPSIPGKVRMYVCGITPYDDSHLGHARAYVVFDIIRRYLEHSGYQVFYVQNITDIDDKIIKRSREMGISIKELADKYTQEYLKDMDALGITRAQIYPKATEHIKEMVEMIKGLIEKGYAYVVDGDVYFEIGKFKDYGKLSKRTQEGMEAGARVEVDERKKDPMDFALWKSSKEGEPSWESPWGPGRPGWHIECSVMASKYLGEAFDIHGGGMDLIFPHHENEIAQAEALTGKPFARYWIHNGFVTINKQKMSKSLGNFFTLKQIYEKFDPETVRFFLLSTHYRSPINFSDNVLREARQALERLYLTLDNLETYIPKAEKMEVEDSIFAELDRFKEKFKEVMDDDFNTAAAVGVLFDLSRWANKLLDEEVTDKDLLTQTKNTILELGGLLGLFQIRKKEVLAPEIEALIKEREKARASKDFKKSDEIRKKLEEQGIILEDTSEGPRWRKKHA